MKEQVQKTCPAYGRRLNHFSVCEEHGKVEPARPAEMAEVCDDFQRAVIERFAFPLAHVYKRSLSA